MRVATVAAIACASASCLREPPRPSCLAVAPIANASTPEHDYDPWLSEDRLELLFASHYQRSSVDLFRTTRRFETDPFDPPVAIEELSTNGEERGPFITDDGLTVWFARGPQGSATLFTATRSSRGGAFGAVTEVKALGSGDHPSLTLDGLVIYFGRVDSNHYNIYTATRPSASSLEFTNPTRVEETASMVGYSVDHPSITGDNDVLYYDTFEVLDNLPTVVRRRRGPDGRLGTLEVVDTIVAPMVFQGTEAPRVLRDSMSLVFDARSAATNSNDLFIDCE